MEGKILFVIPRTAIKGNWMTHKILIVDDSIENRMLLSVILKKHGFEIIEAANGKEAMDICSRNLPDLILLDIVMPQKNGYEVCSEFKALEHTKDIPIIFLSAKDEAEDKIKGLELGAVDYITKPFDKGEVLARVKSQINVYGLTKSLMEANSLLSRKQKKLVEDLKAAAQIQKSLIPSALPEMENFEFAWQFVPCEYIGGDIFNIHRLDENHISVYILDVSGHCVPSAMITLSVSQNLLPGVATTLKKSTDCPPYYEIVSPVDVLRNLDQEYPIERFDKYFTMAYIILNNRTGQVRYSCAAHPMPVLVRASGEIELLMAGGTIIGMGGIIPFEEDRAEMNTGDRLYLYTDGLVEFCNDNGEQYGEKRFYEVLIKSRKNPLRKACENVIESLTAFGGKSKAEDDITLVAIEYKKSAKK